MVDAHLKIPSQAVNESLMGGGGRGSGIDGEGDEGWLVRTGIENNKHPRYVICVTCHTSVPALPPSFVAGR